MNGDGMELGFVAVWRKIMHTAFYKTPNTCHFAVHCLIRANHQPEKVFMNGSLHELKQGEFIAGRKTLSKETGLTEQEIRTSIDHLIKLDFLTIKSTNRFTLFSITNYEEYQVKVTNKITKHQPSINQASTTDNHYNTKEPTDIQVVVNHFKVITGNDINDKAWDKLNYARNTASAKQILDYFKDVEKSKSCITGVKNWADESGLSWTLETVVKRASDWKNGKLKKEVVYYTTDGTPIR